MNPALRSIFAQAAIGLAICAGAYMLLVEPAERQLIEVRAQLDAARHQAAQRGSGAMTAALAAKTRSTLAQSARLMWARNEQAASESQVFESIMKLAAEAGVRVDSMTPASSAAAKPAEGRKADDRRSAFTLNARGEYAQVARFIDSLQRGLGYTDVRSVRISPVNEPGSTQVNAMIETEHVRFDLSAIKPLADAQEHAR